MLNDYVTCLVLVLYMCYQMDGSTDELTVWLCLCNCDSGWLSLTVVLRGWFNYLLVQVLFGWWLESRMSGCIVHWLDGG